MTTDIEQDGQQAFNDACNTAWIDCVQRRGTTVEPDLRAAVRNYFEEGFSYGVEAGEDRQSTRPEPPVTDAEVEQASRAAHEHTRALRPSDHGPYETWEELDEPYRDYLLAIHRAALEAARATREGKNHG